MTDPVVDANANVGPTVYDDFEFDPTFDALDEHLSAADIDGAVVAPLTPPSLDYDRANARLAAELDDRRNYHGIGRIDPRVDDAAAHAERALTEYGLAGLKLHPWEDSYSVTAEFVEPVLSVAADAGAPVWLYAGYPGVSHALSVREVARRFSDVPMVVTHGAQLDISGLSLPDSLLLAEGTQNTYFELSGVYRRDLVEDLVDTVGPGRVVFGTNAPYFHPAVEKTRVTAADLPDDAVGRILGRTVLELLETAG